MAVATEIITLYNELENLIIAEVRIGEQYFAPETVKVYSGSLEDFRIEYPTYRFENEK